MSNNGKLAGHISDGELFADLQVTLTEIFLIQLFDDKQGVKLKDYQSRLNSNCTTRDSIKSIMKDRFGENDIKDFLENGYPR